jgi:diguanylate cyclase (GGDEF)-like protein
LRELQKDFQFDLTIFYEITNVIDNHLLLRVIKAVDPKRKRPAIHDGVNLEINLAYPARAFLNESASFMNRGISKTCVPGSGCDISIYLAASDNIGKGYIVSADYVRRAKQINEYEKSAFTIICLLLSSFLGRDYYRRISFQDSLTGLLNNRALQERVKKIFKKKRQDNVSVSVIMADIDHFKRINDIYGHIQGDFVLKEFASLIMSSLREYCDCVGRYGGEEFLIILERVPLSDAAKIADRLRKHIEGHKFTRVGEKGLPIPSKHISLTASFGIASYDTRSSLQNYTEFINRADKALYLSKQKGRNRVTLYRRGKELIFENNHGEENERNKT